MESTYFFSVPRILQTNENKYREDDEGLEELKDAEVNACAVAKTSIESKENNTYCVSTTILFLDMFSCSRNNTYLCIDTKLSTLVGHCNKPWMAYYQEGENDEIMHIFAASYDYIRGCDAALKMTLSQGRVKCKNGKMIRTSLT
jgi:hypothetical protein